MFRRSSLMVKLVTSELVSACVDNWFLPPPLCLVSWLFPALKYRKCIRHKDTNNTTFPETGRLIFTIYSQLVFVSILSGMLKIDFFILSHPPPQSLLSTSSSESHIFPLRLNLRMQWTLSCELVGLFSLLTWSLAKRNVLDKFAECSLKCLGGLILAIIARWDCR